MKTIRKIIIKVAGLQFYLKFISKIYLSLVKKGMLKKQYPELFYLKEIIKPGFVCIDIGANLGYYSYFLAKHSGKKGKVFAVEPVPLFAEIWKKNVHYNKRKNLKLFPYALGNENKSIRMGMPVHQGIIHHGMTKVAVSANEKYAYFFEAEMRIPDALFTELEKLDFVKCDVEGFEYMVFSNMTETIKRHKPLIQSELSGKENREKTISLLEGMGYTTCLLGEENRLEKADMQEKKQAQKDFYFVI